MVKNYFSFLFKTVGQNYVQVLLNRRSLVVPFILILILGVSHRTHAQYQMEKLNRGLVAVRTGSNNFVSWRWLGTEDDNITFNLYRDGTKVNNTALAITNYTDNGASASASYTVKAIINGVELGASEAATPWAQQYLRIPITAPAGGTSPDAVAYTYVANDASVADLDGDGVLEVILKWDPTNSKDNANSGYTGNTYIDAYKLNGTRMWRIDFGRNIRSGAHYLDFMVYDFDGDGKAEMMARTAEGTKDGTGVVIGSSTADYRNSGGYVLSGPEYITVFNGLTGKAMATRDLYPPRGTVGDWGDTYGNRVDRFRACVAYLDGQRPSAVFVRGYYAKWGCEALDWRDGKLTQRWTYMCANTPSASCYEEGNHNLSVADVDDDGKQEVIMGSNILDDNGTMYYNTANGHGDALHVSDLDPSLPGLEVFNIQERVDNAGAYMYSAKDKKVLWKKASDATATEGPGRGVCADVSSKWTGAECWVYGGLSGELMDCKGNFVGNQPTSGGSGVTCNFLLWWNGDLQREMLDDSRIDNYDLGRITILGSLVSVGVNNSTKKNPCLSGDLIGDWREEVIFRASDNTALYMFTTIAPTTYKFRTLLHDPQYRMAIAWQNTGYNQPPHLSYYLGGGMSTPVKPNIKIVGDNTVYDCSGIPNGTAFKDNCERCVGGATSKTSCISSSEIETSACVYEGILETKNTGFKGSSYINVDNAVGTAISFNILATNAGTATISIRYANGGTIDRPAQISVNGTVLANNLSFPPTTDFATWAAVDVSLNLIKGVNTIKIISATADGLANIDQIGYVSSGLSAGSCVVTGLEESGLAQQVAIYPNPSKASFHVSVSKAANMQVLDIDGRVHEVYMDVTKAELGEKLPSGLYFLKIDNNVYKLIKE